MFWSLMRGRPEGGEGVENHLKRAIARWNIHLETGVELLNGNSEGGVSETVEGCKMFAKCLSALHTQLCP